MEKRPGLIYGLAPADWSALYDKTKRKAATKKFMRRREFFKKLRGGFDGTKKSIQE